MWAGLCRIADKTVISSLQVFADLSKGGSVYIVLLILMAPPRRANYSYHNADRYHHRIASRRSLSDRDPAAAQLTILDRIDLAKDLANMGVP